MIARSIFHSLSPQTECLADSGYLGLMKRQANSRLPHKKSKLHPLSVQRTVRGGACDPQPEDISDFGGALSQPAQAVWPALQLNCRALQPRT